MDYEMIEKLNMKELKNYLKIRGLKVTEFLMLRKTMWNL